ncbi:pyrroline-5-carboxylate reductase 2 [Nephila pilipes]|uniref:pyrroline-5-carboxylate reductase n=1 Tax=Nephila pilipes TaxID=299642 RepID=A0A8X6PZQ2_NEPPI|nr:pyrroline-5-carboxylate reductase 2 [Nephila pilipes]
MLEHNRSEIALLTFILNTLKDENWIYWSWRNGSGPGKRPNWSRLNTIHLRENSISGRRAANETKVDIQRLSLSSNFKVLKDITEHITPQHLVISVAMGITTRHIEKALPPKSRVIRVMPNTPALVREGASVFSCGSNTLEEDATTAHRIFTSVGICEEIEEYLLDAVTGLSGSGPAYMFMAIEALADGAVKMGIRRELAIKLAAQTLLGAAKMVLETGKHPGALKDDVCSPGGTSIQAVHELEKNGFRSALISAVEAATQRSKETGGLF